ncbi:MAG: hypothetical protein HC895_16055 [Leptolyngbyaceae cyanobacterium SM1_3_5]|nr:hypothetical protein [Leptolyngbyaceae cyanobacterium SM1_3_5]
MNFILNSGLQPEVAFADGVKLDLTKTFYPFGQQPQPGTALYLKCTEAFSKRGAKVTFYGQVAETALAVEGEPQLLAEYWDGQQWQSLGADRDRLLIFFKQGYPFELDIPGDLASTKVNGDEGLWIRIRIVEKTFPAPARLPGRVQPPIHRTK